MADLESEFAAALEARSESQQSLEDLLRRQQADDRSYIAKIIVWSFVVLMGWVVVVISVGVAMYDWEGLVEPSKFLMTVLSSVMLPVVTLVIGHYFGKEK